MKYIFGILFIACSLATAQTHSLSGRVYDQQTGLSLAGAMVTVEGTRRGVSTTYDGRFDAPSSAGRVCGTDHQAPGLRNRPSDGGYRPRPFARHRPQTDRFAAAKHPGHCLARAGAGLVRLDRCAEAAGNPAALHRPGHSGAALGIALHDLLFGKRQRHRLYLSQYARL